MQGTTPVLAKEVKKYKQTDGIHEMDLISTEIVNHEKMNSTYNLERTLTLWAWVTWKDARSRGYTAFDVSELGWRSELRFQLWTTPALHATISLVVSFLAQTTTRMG